VAEFPAEAFREAPREPPPARAPPPERLPPVRRVEPLAPAEEERVSPPAENPDVVPPVPEAAPEVLWREFDMEVLANELVAATVEDVLELRSDPLEPDTLITMPPPRPPPIETVTIPPRPPRIEGAIKETYFSAPVLPVKRSVFSNLPDRAAPDRTLTTLVADCAFCCCVQYQ
jgi:hypothetical protein